MLCSINQPTNQSINQAKAPSDTSATRDRNTEALNVVTLNLTDSEKQGRTVGLLVKHDA